MHRSTLILLLTLGLGCSGGAASDPGTDSKKEAKPMANPETKPAAARPEPDRITVAHILISFAGTRTKATRSKADAEKLANEVLGRVKNGEDFNKLIRDLSDDPGEGVYSLCNRGQKKINPDEFNRDDMVGAFGDVGFKLDVGGVGLAVYDPRTSPYGWHIIKRVK